MRQRPPQSQNLIANRPSITSNRSRKSIARLDSENLGVQNKAESTQTTIVVTVLHGVTARSPTIRERITRLGHEQRCQCGKHKHANRNFVFFLCSFQISDCK
jgi:transcription initiation factor IIE alpha subunit